MQRGAASLVVLNVTTGATAVIVAAAGFALQSDTVVNVPIGLGAVLQLLALGGIGVMWWLVRGAFNNLRYEVRAARKRASDNAQRIAYLEGLLKVRVYNKQPPMLPPEEEESDGEGGHP